VRGNPSSTDCMKQNSS